jgi:hypothetical protein
MHPAPFLTFADGGIARSTCLQIDGAGLATLGILEFTGQALLFWSELIPAAWTRG